MTRSLATVDAAAWPVLWTDLDQIPDGLGPTVLTIGQFDGVHCGHQSLLADARERAAALGVPAGAVTFARHPLHLIAPERVPAVLTELDDKARLLHQHGMRFVLALPVTAEMLGTSAERFADEILAGRLRARSVTTGPDFRYGARAAGDPHTLAARLHRHNADVTTVDTVLLDGARVSSTRIRREIAAGRTEQACRLLGRRHRVPVTATGGEHVLPSPAAAWPRPGRYRVTVTARGRSATHFAVVAPTSARLTGLSAHPGDRLTLSF
ncbi:hypothetical protein [Amycolatopsis nigrescens]|uniref:hypothetical protein n=1 Tax=Amycolatopsis nigrescens TaxID=381445 RepID=UPI0003A8946B|nr:hypothetical protein [Amycolatopsis nigrescens]